MKIPMTDRQRARLDQLGILYQGDEDRDEAAMLIRSETKAMLHAMTKPIQLPETAFVIDGEGDRGLGRQWLD